MRLKTASPSVQWSRHDFKHSVASQIPISSIISSSLKRHSERDKTLLCKISLSSNFTSGKFLRSHSLNRPVSRSDTIKRSCSANLDEVFEEESLIRIEGLTHNFDLFEDEERRNKEAICTLSLTNSIGYQHGINSFSHSKFDFLEPIMLGIQPDPPVWPEREAIMRARIERKANNVNLPLSIRMIKKQLLWKEGFRDLEVSEFCSLKKAFSSMVSIILELQNYSVQMREIRQHEDLQGMIAEKKRDLQASFMWLFRQVFSSTPALMIHVMILLANFCLYSTAHNIGIVGPNIQILSRSSPSIPCPNVVPDEISCASYQEFNSAVEVASWNTMVNEAREMQEGLWNVGIDRVAMRWFVAPVTVDLETEDYVEYFKTDLLYQMGLSQDPNDPLLLCNYAQFLHLVAHDYDRAEECFKRAIRVEPADAESLSQYANFLWMVRKDMWGAEERYLQAIAAEPNNPFHASKYANFLWNTGGEETCFPLNTPHENTNASNEYVEE